MAVDLPLPNRVSRSLAPAPGVEVQDPRTRDQLLSTTIKPLKYVDIFIEDILLLGQAPNT